MTKQQFVDYVNNLIENKSKLNLVKTIKDITNWRLRESKEFVDKYADENKGEEIYKLLVKQNFESKIAKYIS